jgi:hypothetical protein
MRTLGLRAFTLRPAPEPRDVLWRGAEASAAARQLRRRTAFVAAAAITVFYAIPFTFLASLTSITNLSKVIPGLADTLADYPGVRAFIEGFLASLGLRIFFLLLPLIMRTLAKAGGARSNSEVTLDAARLYYIFQVFNGLIVFTISGSVFQALASWIDSPLSAVTVLAQVPANMLMIWLAELTSIICRACRHSHLFIARTWHWALSLRFLSLY